MPSAEAQLQVYKFWFAQIRFAKNGLMAYSAPTDTMNMKTAAEIQKARVCKIKHALNVFANRAPRNCNFEIA